jgi:hypothetical protein
VNIQKICPGVYFKPLKDGMSRQKRRFGKPNDDEVGKII